MKFKLRVIKAVEFSGKNSREKGYKHKRIFRYFHRVSICLGLIVNYACSGQKSQSLERKLFRSCELNRDAGAHTMLKK